MCSAYPSANDGVRYGATSCPLSSARRLRYIHDMESDVGTRRNMSSAPWLVAALMALTWTAQPWAADASIRGKVAGFLELVNTAWEDAKDPSQHGYSFREPVLTVPPQHRKPYPILSAEVSVVLLSAGPSADKSTFQVHIGGGMGRPATTVLPPGASIEFKNNDAFVHRLYAVGQESFPASDTAKGGVRKWKVPAAGVYEIRDHAAPNLRIWVVGEPRAARMVTPLMNGDFALPVPEGDFTVQAYFEGKTVSEARPVQGTNHDVDWTRAPLLLKAPKKAKAETEPEEGGKK